MKLARLGILLSFACSFSHSLWEERYTQRKGSVVNKNVGSGVDRPGLNPTWSDNELMFIK